VRLGYWCITLHDAGNLQPEPYILSLLENGFNEDTARSLYARGEAAWYSSWRNSSHSPSNPPTAKSSIPESQKLLSLQWLPLGFHYWGVYATNLISRFRSSNRRSIVQHSRKECMVHKNKQKEDGKKIFMLDGTNIA